MKKLFILSAYLLAAIYVYSQEPGTLDSSFAGKGWTSLDFGKTNRLSETGRQVLIQKDDSYILLLQVEDHNLLTRYLPNGTLDSNFGANGYSNVIPMWNTSAALQNDGKIVVAGSTNNIDFGLARYNVNGSLDSTFGGDDKIATDFFGFTDQVKSVAIQKDGKIIVTGVSYDHYSTTSDFAIARYNVDGTLDSTFDGDGKRTTDFLGGYDIPYAMALQRDNKILVAGRIQNNSTYQSVLVRYNTDGSIDSTFGKDGKSIIDHEGYSFTSIVVQSDEKTILAGSYYDDESTFFTLARYNRNGTLNSSFGKDGIMTIDLTGSSLSVVLQSNGKIVAAGSIYNLRNHTYSVVLVRFNDNGSLDESFGNNGRAITNLEANELEPVIAIVIQNDDKIIATGPAFGDVALARYTKNGSPDKGFDADGMLTGYYPAPGCMPNAVLVQKDGKILVAGMASNFFLARYNRDGTLDSSFDRDGKVTTNLIGSANYITLQKDGKIVVAGLGSDHFSLLRLMKMVLWIAHWMAMEC